jgi:hypothetical protein
VRGDREQKKQFSKACHQQRRPRNMNSNGAFEVDMAAKIEVLERLLGAALALRENESSDQRKD